MPHRGRRQRGGKIAGRLIVAATVSMLIGSAVAVMFFRAAQQRAVENMPVVNEERSLVPVPVKTGGYVTSAACRDCHPSQHQSWYATYHRTMTQLATDATVLGDFDDVKLESRNRRYHLQRKDGEFLVTMADPYWETYWKNEGKNVEAVAEPPMVTRKIVMTTGSHNMQGYWFNGEDGNVLWQLPWWFLIDEQRWIPREDAFLAPPSAERHWIVWNMKCILCHSVAGYPGLDYQHGTMNTEVAELGIACEACHGPGDRHVKFHRNSKQALPAGKTDPTILNPAKQSHEVASEVCAQCHSYFRLHDEREYHTSGLVHQPGDPLQNSRELVRFGTPAHRDHAGRDNYEVAGFWPDGTCRVGGDEYQGLLETPCFQRGTMSCLSCHSMHESDPNDMLARQMEGNEACLQCHEDFRGNVAAHTHHGANSSGSLCYNCHMPHTTFALLKAIRSHRVDSPSAAVSASTGRPNACNLCHLDRSLAWTAEHLSDWYGLPPVELSSEHDQTAASLQWLWQGDAVQRAVTAWSYGWQPAQQASGTEWMPPMLGHLLDDPYAAVRYVAFRSLSTLPEFGTIEFDYLADDRQRSQIREDVFRTWRYDPSAVSAEKSERLLLDHIKHRDETFRRFIGKRDDKPVEIME